MDKLISYFKSLPITQKILNSECIKLGNSSLGYNTFLIMTDFYSSDKSIFVVLPSLIEAQKYYDNLSKFINPDDVLFFPADELLSTEMISSSGDFLYERIETIYTLINDNKKIIVTNMHGAIKYEMNKSRWNEVKLKICLDSTFDIDKLSKKLIMMGYESVFTISKTGEFSKRGSILDIFPLGYKNPIRIDFFGDDVDTIKEFDIDTQRSLSKIEYVNVLPVSELIYDEEDIDLFKRRLFQILDNFELSQIEDDFYKHDIMNLTFHKSLDNLGRYVSLLDLDKMNIFDYKDEKKIYIIDPIKSKENYERLMLDLIDSCGRMGWKSLTGIDMFKKFDDILSEGNVIIEGLRDMGGYDYDINARDITPYKANKKAIIDDMRDYKDMKILIVGIKDNEKRKKLREVLEDEKIPLTTNNNFKYEKGIVHIVDYNLPSFFFLNDDLMLIDEDDIFQIEHKNHKTKYKSIYKNAQKISRYDELEIGDYVVHYDYGIGIYQGIITLELSGIKRDVLKIMYGNKSGLYIPLEQISSVMKYASKDVEGVVINTIGDTAWARAKARVRKRVHDISEKLIKIYSERKMSQGFKYPADSIEQEDFESEFEYELTLDQEKALNDVKRDMENQKPMDRLICGDVGYGKTEVALRAAFKAILAGKQVAMLTPTTILARQHFYTFKNRMDKYGIRVELLSRFVPKSDQEKIISGIKSGSVDMVIGTHRLLSNEVIYKDLGLLIVDEEQRFGVTHKEKIKELKVNVDCITLTATPIPRTLQMSMMGLKDLSMIETPPKNRYPIQTYVLERNDKIITQAIERELVRGGQVFYLYNLVDSIEDVASHIHELVPEARICIGHGRLTKDELEKRIQKFIDKEYDVLVCTTIIETGIDMPDTNTLIIHEADKLGLSQMYQIRGRVGRSSKIAYAYLMYEPRKVLTKEAEKRLETIKEFNELGSGFKIAMRDLSIRGSGDLLGEEQSGFIESVGIDMYLKILDEEINNKKEEKKIVNQPIVSRTINDKYIPNDDIRIKIHKRIDKLESINEMNDLINELIDRFGPVPEELLIYMKESLMKNKASNIGIDKIDLVKDNIRFSFKENLKNQIDGLALFDLSTNYPNIKLSYNQGKVEINLNMGRTNKEALFDEMIDFIDKIFSLNIIKEETIN